MVATLPPCRLPPLLLLYKYLQLYKTLVSFILTIFIKYIIIFRLSIWIFCLKIYIYLNAKQLVPLMFVRRFWNVLTKNISLDLFRNTMKRFKKKVTRIVMKRCKAGNSQRKRHNKIKSKHLLKVLSTEAHFYWLRRLLQRLTIANCQILLRLLRHKKSKEIKFISIPSKIAMKFNTLSKYKFQNLIFQFQKLFCRQTVIGDLLKIFHKLREQRRLQ